MSNKKTLKVIELFAGVGGFRLGLEGFNGKSSSSMYKKDLKNLVDYKIVYSNQWEPSTNTQHASLIYESKFGKEGHFNSDISDLDVKQLKEKCDVLVGGFPCQDYSVANSLRSSKGLLGKKGVLWWQIERLLSDLGKKKPKYLILENVDRLLKSPVNNRGRDFAVMVASLNDLGYTVEWRILNAAEYGFPQRRRRIFIIGYLANTPIDKQRKKSNQKDWITSLGVLGKSFPCVEKNSNTEFELIGNLEKISNTSFSKNGKSSFYNSGISINRKVYSLDVKKETVKWKMTLGDIIEKNIKKIPEEFWVDEKDHQKWEDVKGAKQKERTSKSGHKYMFSEGKMDTLDSYDKPSRTIITSEGGKTPSRVKHLIEHNKKWRRLIPSELEQLNMFPKDFTNYKDISNNKRAFLMGNALVVGLVEKIGETISLFDSK